MADIDILPKRAVPTAALVDSNGVASNGSLTTTQLAARGMASLCAVDGTGTSLLGATLAQIARRGIQTFCPVDEFGVAQDSSTADQLRKRGISPMVLLDPGGVALTGSANMETLRKRSLGYFCPLDEAGNATTMGAVILISNSTIQDISAVGTNVGVLSVVGGTGTYTFTLTNNAGGRFAVAGTNGVNLNTASAVTAGTYAVTVSATNGVTPISRTINILVTLYVPATLTASVGVFPFAGETMTPTTGYMVIAAVGTFPFAGQNATLIPPVSTVFTFDPANKGSFADLFNSNRDLKGNNSAPGWESARAITGTTSAKQYVEFKLLSMGASRQIMVGVCDATFTVTTNDTYLGKNGQSVGFYLAGGPFTSSMSVANSVAGMTTFADNDIIMMALDATAGKLWVGLNNTWGVGSPSAGTLPWVTFTPGATLYFAATCHIGVQFVSLPATLAYTPPAGFTGTNA